MPHKARGPGRAIRGASANAALSSIRNRVDSIKKGSSRSPRIERGYSLGDQGDESDDDDQQIKTTQKVLWERVQQFLKDIRRDPDRITISVNKLQQEAKLKADRSSRVSAGWRFFLFFGLYAAVMIIQKNAGQSESVTSSVIDYFISSQYRAVRNTIGTDWPDRLGPGNEATGCFVDACMQPTYLTKGFLDILDIADFWDWMQNHFMDLLYTVCHH